MGRAAASSPTAERLAAAVAAAWPAAATRSAVRWWSAPAASRCCSSIPPLIEALHAAGFEIAVETNGTVEPPAGLDWLCVSPKAEAPLVVRTGDELKLVYPQDGAEPERFAGLAFRHFFLQPMDGPAREANTARGARLLPRAPALATEPADA